LRNPNTSTVKYSWVHGRRLPTAEFGTVLAFINNNWQIQTIFWSTSLWFRSIK
jgi:hypothetical protein